MDGSFHSLLRRQLKRHGGDPATSPQDWRGFIEAVNQAYAQADLDRLMIERSLDLSSEELMAANAEMRRAVAALQEAHLALESRVAERTSELTQANQSLQRAMEEQRRLEDQLRQATRLEAIGRLAGGVAHDFNNLLVVIVSQAEFLLERSKLESSTRAAREILEAAESAAGLIRQLLAFSRRQTLTPVVLEVNSLVQSTTAMLSRLIGEHIDVVVDLDPAAGYVSADRSQLQQVLLNLATNARDAMPDGGTLTIRTSVEAITLVGGGEGSLPAGSYAVISVSDTGSGMTADVLAHIFEPFFTTKEQQHGTGLGLSTAYGIVRQSNGRLEVQSAPGQGAHFRVWLPQAESTGASEAPPTAPVAARSAVVLVVEDQDAVRRSIRARLEHAGFVVFDAADGAAALKMAASLPALDLLITDVVMPRMSGRELARQLNEAQPGLRVIYMTGYVNDAELARELSDPRRLVLQKPFRADRLLAAVQQALGG